MTTVLSSSPGGAPGTEVHRPRSGADVITVWGLDVRALHDAFWTARGVQCVRRATVEPLQRAAELYLLLEPGQLVLLDLAALSDRLTWRNATVTRLRVTDRDEETYTERVVSDERGFVQRIERRYGAGGRGSSRVILTPSRRVAQIWMGASGRREGWDRVRRSVAWAQVDHWRCAGSTYLEDDDDQQRELLAHLVERWPRPAQALDGVVETEPGVWTPANVELPPGCVRVGPLWLGHGAEGSPARQRCLVGPGFVPDAVTGPAAGVRPIAQVELAERPIEPITEPAYAYQLAKRALDLILSVPATLVLLPIMALVAVLILLEDGGPVLFGHRRQGRGGRPFTCWKFRTMHVNAETITDELEEYNICDGPQVYIRDDPRVTRIGAILRRTHLDEMPQFFNVLLGQMSLVGPRPSPDDENQFCPAWRDARLSVRPGITGLWQLERTRRPGEDFQEWIRYDIEYVRHASMWVDLTILARTAWMMLTGR